MNNINLGGDGVKRLSYGQRERPVFSAALVATVYGKTTACLGEVNQSTPSMDYTPGQEGTCRPRTWVHRTYNDTKSKDNLPLWRTSSTIKLKTEFVNGLHSLKDVNSTTIGEIAFKTF